MPEQIFEHLGFFLEFYKEDKFIGSIILEEPDREEVGYYSRIDHIAVTDIKLSNGRTIKKWESYYTRMYPLCGRVLDKEKHIFKTKH